MNEQTSKSNEQSVYLVVAAAVAVVARAVSRGQTRCAFFDVSRSARQQFEHQDLAAIALVQRCELI